MPRVRVLADRAAKLDQYLCAVLTQAGENQKLLFVGDGVAPYQSALTEALGSCAVFPPAHLSFLRPSAVAMLAALAEPVDYLTLMPLYLRAPQAERARRGLA
jgi:hypothetical protein